MKKIVITILIVCFTLTKLYSQPHTSWLNYSYSELVTGIDISGTDIWISTFGGLVKYNKTNGAKTYFNRANSNLPDNRLLNVYCNLNGDVWVGGYLYGIGKLNGNTCEIYNQANSGLPFDIINSRIKTDKSGNLWISSYRYMAKFDGVDWKTWITGSDFSAFAIVSGFDIDSSGVVWVFSSDGIGKIENDEYTIVSTIGSDLISKTGCVAIDNEQNLWVAIENMGLFKYNGSAFINYTTSNSCLPTNYIWDISFDMQNTLWLATDIGLVKFNDTGCSLFSPPVSDKFLTTVKYDTNDTVWCGTLSGKLLCFNGTDFTSIEVSNSPLKDNYNIYTGIDYDNTVWISTAKNTVTSKNFQFTRDMTSNITAICVDKDGNTYKAFLKGDTCILKTGKTGSVILTPFPTGTYTINKMICDKNDVLWIATSNGLYKYDGQNFTNYNTSNSAIPTNSVGVVEVDEENNIWGGTTAGLFKSDGISTWTVWDTSNSSIPTNKVLGLAFDSKNNLWFSCMDEDRMIGIEFGGGLTRFNGTTMETYNIYNSGIFSNTIWDVHIDNSDMIWLSSCGAGLMSFDGKDKWESYNVTNSGIASNDVQKIAQDKDGNLWLGHIRQGISVFNPNSPINSTNKNSKLNSHLSIYPNPVNDKLFVNLESNKYKTVQANIYDLNGKLLYSFPEKAIVPGTRIIEYKLSHILASNQLYILNITTDKDQLNARFLYVGK